MFIVIKMGPFKIINDKPTNVKNKIIGKSYKLVKKVYISYMNKIIEKHNINIERNYSLDNYIIKNTLKDFFIGYKKKFIDKEGNIDEKTQIPFDTIHNIFKIKFIDLLTFANFPIKNKNSSINIDEEIKEIINEERKKINFNAYYKNKKREKIKIYLDELKPNKIKKRNKFRSKNNNYKQFVDYGDNQMFTKFLDENIYEIINILFFQDQKTTLEKCFPNKEIKDENSTFLQITDKDDDKNENKNKLSDFYVVNDDNENYKIFDSSYENNFIDYSWSEKENKNLTFINVLDFNISFKDTKEMTTEDFFLRNLNEYE